MSVIGAVHLTGVGSPGDAGYMACAGQCIAKWLAPCWQGIFATHLHQLLDVDLRAPRLRRFMMETRRQPDGKLEPTCRMVPGQSTESLALEVAAKSGLPSEIVDRAAQLYEASHPIACSITHADRLGLCIVMPA